MKRLFPKPRLSALIFLVWLIAQMSVSPDQLVVAAVIATLVPLMTRRFWPDAPKVKQGWLLGRYLFVFLYDLVVANLQVAWWILLPQRKLKPCFLYVPLDVEHPFTITLLASTVSLTPGTVSSHVSADRKMLIVHCLHTEDEAETVRQIKARYERPLMEIFA